MAGKVFKPAANHLRAWRERAGLTQAKLGELAGTKAGVISELESGETQLTPKWMDRLAPHLGTRSDFLRFNPNSASDELIMVALEVPQEKRADAAEMLRIFSRK